jgi:hypothetical protein
MEVCAVHNGAQWLHGLVDSHRADAVRLLDIATSLSMGKAVQAAEGRVPAHWLEGV